MQKTETKPHDPESIYKFYRDYVAHTAPGISPIQSALFPSDEKLSKRMKGFQDAHAQAVGSMCRTNWEMFDPSDFFNPIVFFMGLMFSRRYYVGAWPTHIETRNEFVLPSGARLVFNAPWEAKRYQVTYLPTFHSSFFVSPEACRGFHEYYKRLAQHDEVSFSAVNGPILLPPEDIAHIRGYLWERLNKHPWFSKTYIAMNKSPGDPTPFDLHRTNLLNAMATTQQSMGFHSYGNSSLAFKCPPAYIHQMFEIVSHLTLAGVQLQEVDTSDLEKFARVAMRAEYVLVRAGVMMRKLDNHRIHKHLPPVRHNFDAPSV